MEEEKNKKQQSSELENQINLNPHLFLTKTELKNLTKEYWKEREFEEMSGEDFWYYVGLKAELEQIEFSTEQQELKREAIKHLEEIIDSLANQRELFGLDMPF